MPISKCALYSMVSGQGGKYDIFLLSYNLLSFSGKVGPEQHTLTWWWEYIAIL